MDPAYDLTDVDDARRFLEDHSRRARFHPPGHQHITVGYLANLADLADPARRLDRADQSEHVSGDEALAALTLLADLRTWLTEMEPDLIGAARQAGVTWDELAPVLGVGDRRAAQRRHARLTAAVRTAQEEAERADRLAALPADTRPAPDVAKYDRLLIRPPRVGHDWADDDVCLWRDEGRWGLNGPTDPIHVEGMGGLFAGIAAGDTKGAQAAAAAAVVALTGREVIGWDRDEHARTVHGPSSWYACLARTAATPAP